MQYNHHIFSVSQLKLARTCLRKWYLQYVLKAQPDYTVDFKALAFGKVYHKSLETDSLCADAALSSAESLAAYKLAKKTKETMSRYNFSINKAEVYFQAYYRGLSFRGYLDAFGRIGDSLAFAEFKTASQLSESDRLAYDLQVLFYNYFSGLNAEYIVYHQVIKPQIKQNKNETEEEFAERFAAKAEQKLDIISTSNLASLKECEEQLDELLAPCLEILHRNREPKAIYTTSACQNFGKPCEFWSYCFGCNRKQVKSEITF